MKQIKVLHVVGAMNRAGTETMLMNLYRNVEPEKFHFDFVSYDPCEADYDQEIEHLHGRIIKLTKTNSVRQLYRAIKQYGPYDAVHAHTLFHCGIACLAAFLAGVKIRISHAHTTLDTHQSVLGRLYMTVMRFFILAFSTSLLACSNEAGRYLFGHHGLMKQKYAYFPNAIDYTRFLVSRDEDVNKFKSVQGLDSRSIVIGHIGTFKESKNHTFLLKVMKCLVDKGLDMKLVLAGDGELKDEMQAEAKRLGLMEYVKFIGIREDIPTILHSMDVFVFPSIYEGLGLVLLEAQASGIPCIVSEAIQPEADLGLGLMEMVSLDDGADIWAEKLMQMVGKRESNLNKITEAFERSGYSIRTGITMLKDQYSVNGGAYEKSLDRLL